MREAAVQAAMQATAAINAARAKEKPPKESLCTGQVAGTLVPANPLHDTGFLLGFPDTAALDALRDLGTRQDETNKLVAAATGAALHAVHMSRCDERAATRWSTGWAHGRSTWRRPN